MQVTNEMHRMNKFYQIIISKNKSLKLQIHILNIIYPIHE